MTRRWGVRQSMYVLTPPVRSNACAINEGMRTTLAVGDSLLRTRTSKPIRITCNHVCRKEMIFLMTVPGDGIAMGQAALAYRLRCAPSCAEISVVHDGAAAEFGPAGLEHASHLGKESFTRFIRLKRSSEFESLHPARLRSSIPRGDVGVCCRITPLRRPDWKAGT